MENGARSSRIHSAERGRGISCYTDGSRDPHTSKPSSPPRWMMFGRPGLLSFPGIRSNSRRRGIWHSPGRPQQRERAKCSAGLSDRGLVGRRLTELARPTSFNAPYARKSFADRPTTPTSDPTREEVDTRAARVGEDICSLSSDSYSCVPASAEATPRLPRTRIAASNSVQPGEREATRRAYAVRERNLSPGILRHGDLPGQHTRILRVGAEARSRDVLVEMDSDAVIS